MSQPIAETTAAQWVYVDIKVHDDGRVLSPTHACSDHLTFDSPPQLHSRYVEIVVTSGKNEFRTEAEVLQNKADATEIPIRLVTAQPTV